MTTSTPLERLAFRLRICSGVAAVLLVLVTIAAIVPGLSGERIAATLDLEGVGQNWAIASTLIVTALIVLALLALMKMLRAIEGGDIFGRVPTLYFRRFAMLMTVAAFANLLVPIAGQLAATAQSGTRVLKLTATGADLLLILLGVLLLLIARLFEMAARYEEDSKAIV